MIWEDRVKQWEISQKLLNYWQHIYKTNKSTKVSQSWSSKARNQACVSAKNQTLAHVHFTNGLPVCVDDAYQMAGGTGISFDTDTSAYTHSRSALAAMIICFVTAILENQNPACLSRHRCFKPASKALRISRTESSQPMQHRWCNEMPTSFVQPPK